MDIRSVNARPDSRRKIVRDLLCDRIPAAALSYAADLDAHRVMLAEKSAEEMDEIRASGYVDPSEYADALEILVSLAELSGVDWAEVERVRIAKRASRGAFLSGLVYDPEWDPERPQQAV